MKPFIHGYQSHELDAIGGYSRCLNDVLTYIKDTTNFDPAKRMMDSVPLLDKIGDTAKEFHALFELEKKKLDSITKTIERGTHEKAFISQEVKGILDTYFQAPHSSLTDYINKYEN